MCGTDAGFNIHAAWGNVMRLSHELAGAGKATVDWGNGHNPERQNNFVKLFHNNISVDTIQRKGRQTTTISFGAGDTLTLEEGYAII